MLVRGASGRFMAGAALVLGVGVAIRLPGLAQSLWLDEVFRTFVGLGGERARWLLWGDVHNPLYNLVMFAWIRVVGDGELAVRAPSVLAGFALIAAVWFWARSRFGVAAANVAGAWLVVAPVHVWYSTEAKNNIVTALLATLAVMALDGAIRRRTLGCVLGAGAAAFGAVATDFQSLLVLGPAWVFMAWQLGRGNPRAGNAWPPGGSLLTRGLPLWASLGAGAAFLIPWTLFRLTQDAHLARHYVGYFNWHEGLRLLLVWLPTGNVIPPLPGEGERGWHVRARVGVVLVGPGLWAGLRAARGTGAGRLVLLGLLAPMVLMFVGNELLVQTGSRVRLYQPRNLIVIVPWYALVLGLGAAAPGRWKWYAAGVPLALALAGSVAMRTLWAGRESVSTPNPDWRGAGAWLRARDDPGGTRLAVLSNTILMPLEYYAPGRALEQAPLTNGLMPDAERLVESLRVREFVLMDDPFWGPAISAADWVELGQRFEVVERAEFRSLRVARVRVPFRAGQERGAGPAGLAPASRSATAHATSAHERGAWASVPANSRPAARSSGVMPRYSSSGE